MSCSQNGPRVASAGLLRQSGPLSPQKAIALARSARRRPFRCAWGGRLAREPCPRQALQRRRPRKPCHTSLQPCRSRWVHGPPTEHSSYHSTEARREARIVRIYSRFFFLQQARLEERSRSRGRSRLPPALSPTCRHSFQLPLTVQKFHTKGLESYHGYSNTILAQ